uniref:Thioredoxin domain-containing protein n=1 Tax=Heliothis virescens TaxID=7102 RepID=A0A2A4JWB4_HELVI
MDRQAYWRILLLLCIILIQESVHAKKQKTAVITDLNDIKEFKKLLRTKTNVLILFVNNQKGSQSVTDVFKDTADAMKGQATLAIIDCNNSDGKKLCKKLKIGSDKSYYLKHYKDGEYHKDYDRNESVNSLSNFLRDPTGDLPWDEDPTATDIFHLQDGEALNKFLKKGAGAYKKSMIMFYAPWCGYCKTLKPEYVQAAADLKGESLLAAIDVSKPGNSKIRQLYNITGFPTLLYYEKGQYKLPYNGENKRQAIVDFMRDPTTAMQQKKKEVVDESWSEDTDVVHLTAANFEDTLAKIKNALVVFYAPWCGHCKRIKPEFEKAAKRIKEEKIDGILAAVDATKQPDLASRFGVKGYPTLKYFSKGEYQFDAGHARQEEQIISFIKDPKEPPPPPPPEKPWAEEETPVRHLDSATFRNTLRKIKHAIIMFYAPWCGHCKSTKPEFVRAAENFADELMVAFGAVDCTTDQELCANYDVRGYPTIKYFSYFDKNIMDYTGGRKEADFISFIHNQAGTHPTAQKEIAGLKSGFGVEVVLVSDVDFENIIAAPNPSFVMFYAKWCKICNTAKPEITSLAVQLRREDSTVKVYAVDASENPKVSDLVGIKTVPTFKLFKNGKEIATYKGGRTTEDMFKFCVSHEKDPKESPVLRFLEKPWTEEETPVRHLDSATFQNTLRKIKHAIIMSHPPWCGYWSVKPGFVRAAENLADDLMVAFGAADCTLNQIKLHDNYDLQGCPTVNHFRYMDKNSQDTGGRKVAGFIPFVHNQARTYTTLSNEFTTQNTGFNDEVTIASDVDFERVIASPAPTFIMFYSPSCATCTQLKPDVNRLAVKLRQVESPVAVCAVNATENPRVADIVGITTLPLYNMYSNGNLIATYTGDRTSADMFEFCLIHHTVKIDS